ncbi:hypothetical protein WMO40_23150 [Bacillaceae bacterium CLA-AA-H227]|uniref:Uncharacterized protein n=1 Tax=Robertmurraya yapensis (ex Hitch et al 2024) TaxID=3133160 RepID=A0ACC6SHX9_9BACI
MQKKAGIRRGKVKKRNPYRPDSKIPDFGFSQILKRIDRAIELIDQRR